MPTVLITGCSTGFGRETALYFIEKGWTVFATMRNPAANTMPASERMSSVSAPPRYPRHLSAIHLLSAIRLRYSYACDDIFNIYRNVRTGLHDLAQDGERQSVAQYRENLANITATLRAVHGSPRLFWISSTPVPNVPLGPPVGRRPPLSAPRSHTHKAV